MNHKDLAYRVSLMSLSLLVLLAIGMNVFNFSASTSILQIIGGALSLLFFIPGAYLWVDGFKRFKPTIGYYGGKWIIYVCFNILAGLYLHYLYNKRALAS